MESFVFLESRWFFLANQATHTHRMGRLVSHCDHYKMGSVENSSGAEIVTIDVKAAKGMLQSGYIYLDVRTVEEYNKGHVDAEKIFNIPYMFNSPEGRVKNPEFLAEVRKVCKEDDQLLVGCRSGVRSLYATLDLFSGGFKDVSNVGGGYLAWVENKFPLKVEVEPKSEL